MIQMEPIKSHLRISLILLKRKNICTFKRESHLDFLLALLCSEKTER